MRFRYSLQVSIAALHLNVRVRSTVHARADMANRTGIRNPVRALASASMNVVLPREQSAT